MKNYRVSVEYTYEGCVDYDVSDLDAVLAKVAEANSKANVMHVFVFALNEDGVEVEEIDVDEIAHQAAHRAHMRRLNRSHQTSY